MIGCRGVPSGFSKRCLDASVAGKRVEVTLEEARRLHDSWSDEEDIPSGLEEPEELQRPSRPGQLVGYWQQARVVVESGGACEQPLLFGGGKEEVSK